MNTRKALFLAAILGAIAIALAAVLLRLGQSSHSGDPAVQAGYEAQRIDAAAMVRLLETLSSDALQGRAIGTPGNDAARGFILKRYETLRLRPMQDGFEQPFSVIPSERNGMATRGVNIVGWIAGETPGEGPILVITAHYDHLGVVNDEIYNGADDNASGVSAMIAIAHHLRMHPPQHDIVFAALDGEEVGFLGANALVRRLMEDAQFNIDRVALNINLDMVSRSDVGELYVAGTYHTPEFSTLFIDDLITRAPVTLLKGHDSPDLGADDWSRQSDHAAFLNAGIPFLYFGVEDHAGYHQPSDDASEVTVDFYARAADTIAMAVAESDAVLEDISKLRSQSADQGEDE